MDKHPVGDLMSTVMEKLREMVDVNTVVGQAITTPDNTTIIPISRVAFGFGAGGADMNQTSNLEGVKFGGGSGAGINISPVGFLVVQGDTIKLLPVSKPAGSTVDRVVELLPEVIEKIENIFSSHKKPKEDDVFED